MKVPHSGAVRRVDTSALDIVRAVRDEFIDLQRPPTSSLVQVAGLFNPDLLIEIEAVAAAPTVDDNGPHAHG